MYHIDTIYFTLVFHIPCEDVKTTAVADYQKIFLIQKVLQKYFEVINNVWSKQPDETCHSLFLLNSGQTQ